MLGIIAAWFRLTDLHWERIREHFPEESIPDGRPGRKPVPTRDVLEAVLWILNTGAQWHMLPQVYPYQGSQEGEILHPPGYAPPVWGW